MPQRRSRRHSNILSTLNRSILPVAAATLVLSRGHCARAATPDTWNGTAGDFKWTTAANWSAGLPPVTPTYDDLTFGTGSVGTIALGGNEFSNSLTFNAGFTLDPTGTSDTLTDSTGSISIGSSVTATINAILTGSGGLNVTGSGDVILTAADTYSNSTSITGGTLTANNSSALNSASPLTVGTLGSIILNAPTTFALGSSVNNSGNFTISNTGSFTFNTTGTVFTQTAGTLTINGSLNTPGAGFTYTGGSIIGTVQIGNNSFAPTLTLNTGAGNSGTFIVGGKGATFSGANPANIQSNQTLTLQPTASAGTLSVSASGGMGNAGNINIIGSASSSATMSLSTHTLTNTGTLTTSVTGSPSSAVDFFAGNINNTAGTVNINASTGENLDITNSSTFSIATLQSLSMSLSSPSTTAFMQSGGSLTINGSLLCLDTGFADNGGTITGTVTLGNASSGTPGLTFGASAGNSGSFLFTGLGGSITGNEPSGVTVTLQPTASSGTLTLPTGFANSGTMDLIGSSTSTATFSGTSTLTNSGTINISNTTSVSTANQIISKVLTNNSGANVNVNASLQVPGTVNNSGTVTIASGTTLTVTTNLSQFNQIAGQVNVSSSGTLNVSAAELTLNGGTITLAASASTPGVLKMGAMQFTGTSTTGTIASGAVGGGQSPGYVDLGGATQTLAIGPGTQAQQVIISAPVTDGGLNISGSGVIELSGASTYSLGTTLTGATLEVANSSGSATGTGTVTLNSGTLESASSGSISGNVVAGSAAHTIAPGGVGSVGTLSIGGLTSSSLTTLDFDLGSGAGPEISNGDLLLLGSGTTSIGSGTNLTFGGPTTVVGDDYRLIGGTLTGITLGNFTLPTAPVGQSYALSTSVDSGFIDLVVSAGAVGPANLSWNNAGGATPADGQTWDINNNKNWNNGSSPNTVYTDGANVTFNDSNNATSNGGTNANAYNVTLSTLVTPTSVIVNNSLGNYTISGTGTIGGTGALTKSGSASLTISTTGIYTGGTNVTAGTMVVAAAAAIPNASAVSISGSATMQLADNITAGTPYGTSNVVLSSLSIAGNGVLDIGNNRIIIDYTTGNDPISTIQQWIANGFTNGDAAGVGPEIISSDIATDDSSSGLSYGIGYADGADGLIAGLPSGEIEIMFTLLGDANLDGFVNSEDYTPFSHNIGQSGMSWDDGDFNYDGTVNSEDYTPFSHNIGQSASLAAAAGTLESANGLNITSVPEPASVALVLIPLAGLLRRRSRRNSRD
jgi:fibronectin-binding autotransporter adhesin